MLKQKTVALGDTDFLIEQLPATEGLEVTIALGKIIAGAAEGVSDEFVLTVDSTKVNVGKLIAGVINTTDVKGTPEFIKQTICKSVVKPDLTKGGSEFDIIFAGHYDWIAEILEEIIVHNGFHELVKKNLSRTIALLQ
jgi:hypothetical protein